MDPQFFNKINSQPSDTNVIDVIASGISRESFPIEIGLVLASGQRYQALVKPGPSWRDWSPAAERRHGITREKLIKNGKTPRQICEELLNICDKQTIYSDCWVMDNYWLDKLFFSAQIENTLQCAPIDSLLNDDQLASWCDKKHFVSDLFGHKNHRALDQAVTVRMALSIFFSEEVYEFEDQQLPLAELAVI